MLLASFTSCVARCSRCHCTVMPVAMMARTAASAVIEAMYIDARIISKPRSRAGGNIEPGFGVQQFDSEWLKNPFEKPDALAQLGPLNRLASSSRTRRFERRASSSSEIDVGSVSSTDQDGGKRRGDDTEATQPPLGAADV